MASDCALCRRALVRCIVVPDVSSKTATLPEHPRNDLIRRALSGASIATIWHGKFPNDINARSIFVRRFAFIKANVHRVKHRTNDIISPMKSGFYERDHALASEIGNAV